MHRTVIGWVIYVGRHCRSAKIFYLSQPGIEPRTLDLQANTLPRRCKSRLLPQGSRSVFIYTGEQHQPTQRRSPLHGHDRQGQWSPGSHLNLHGENCPSEYVREVGWSFHGRIHSR